MPLVFLAFAYATYVRCILQVVWVMVMLSMVTLMKVYEVGLGIRHDRE